MAYTSAISGYQPGGFRRWTFFDLKASDLRNATSLHILSSGTFDCQTRIWIICVRDMLIIIYNNMHDLYTSFLFWDIMTYNRTCHGIELIHWFIHTPALRFELYLVQLPHPSGSNLDVSISGITHQWLKWFSDGIVYAPSWGRSWALLGRRHWHIQRNKWSSIWSISVLTGFMMHRL